MVVFGWFGQKDCNWFFGIFPCKFSTLKTLKISELKLQKITLKNPHLPPFSTPSKPQEKRESLQDNKRIEKKVN